MQNQNTSQICVNCVMDTSDTRISFDERGFCDHCQTFYQQTLPNWPKSDLAKKHLTDMANEIKSNGIKKDFDCIIGMSGGIDSSYLVYAAKEIMGLRPLVFHVDAGWNSQIAVNNIERIIEAKNCSTGEQKSILLSIFLSVAKMVKDQNNNRSPIILIDEAMAHLDLEHKEFLFSELESLKSQVWFSGVSKDLFENINNQTVFFDMKNVV